MSAVAATAPASPVDVAIIGAGVAGTAAAISLRQAGVGRVALIESSGPMAFRIGESVPPDIRPMLASLGVLDRFLSDDHAKCLGSVSCWGSNLPGHNDFIFNPHGHGWHLDRPLFERLLRDAAQRAGVAFLTGQRVVRALPAATGGVHLQLAAGECLAAGWVIDATGYPAGIARQLGGFRVEDDRLICVSRFLGMPADRHLDRLSHLEAVAEGWWYAADLGGGRAVAMLATDGACLRDHGLAQPEGWQAALARTSHLAPLLAGSKPLDDSSGLHIRIAPSARLGTAAGRNWLAAGDAATAFDPVAAQGITHALATGRAAGEAIAAILAGDHAAAERYARAVRTSYAGYLANRAHLYGIESRWPTSPFWIARRSAIAAAAADAIVERRAG